MKTIAKILGLDAEATEEQILEALKGALDTSAIAKALELKDDATSEEILDAIKTLSEDKGGEDTETLEDRAKKEGKVLVSEEKLSELGAKAARGDKAFEELHQSKFETAFERALKDPKGARVDAKEETREKYEKLYAKAPEETIEILDGLPHLVNGEGRGGSGDESDTESLAEDREELDTRVKARMKDKNEDYITALEAVMAEEQS